MSLMKKLRKIFKKDNENNLIPQKDEVIPPSEWKHGNMVIFAPTRSLYGGEEGVFFIEAYDESSNPLEDEEIHLRIGNEEYTAKTNKEGLCRVPFTLKRGKYDVEITYPNGDYSQILKSYITVKKQKQEKQVSGISKKEKVTDSKKEDLENKDTRKDISFTVPDMKMFVNDEGHYYVRLRRRDGYVPIEGEEIKFTIDEEVFTAKTDKMGFARLPIKDLLKGTYEVKAEYEGSSEYKPFTRKGKLEMLTREVDKRIIIEVDHLSMEFKVSKDKIDTLKEFIIRTLKRSKESHEKIRVLDDVSFKVYKGEKLGILGFNGAGKSTLLKIMAGIYEPTSGSITTYGRIAPLLELGAGFDKNYTGKNNIFLNGALLSLDEKFLKEKYDEIVEFSELGEFINYPIKNYSSGMRTKLGFSIATLINPDILIVDEILSVGDIKFRKKSGDKINSMMREGVTVLLVSHSIRQMKDICDRCIWLENGRVKMDGDANEVCDAYVKGAKKDIKKRK